MTFKVLPCASLCLFPTGTTCSIQLQETALGCLSTIFDKLSEMALEGQVEGGELPSLNHIHNERCVTGKKELHDRETVHSVTSIIRMQQNLEILQEGLTSLFYLHKKIKSSNQNTEIACFAQRGRVKYTRKQLNKIWPD